MSLISGDPKKRHVFNPGTFHWDEEMNRNWVVTVRQLNETEAAIRNVVAGLPVGPDGRVLLSGKNLSDLGDVDVARANIGAVGSVSLLAIGGGQLVGVVGPEGARISLQDYLDLLYAERGTSGGGSGTPAPILTPNPPAGVQLLQTGDRIRVTITAPAQGADEYRVAVVAPLASEIERVATFPAGAQTGVVYVVARAQGKHDLEVRSVRTGKVSLPVQASVNVTGDVPDVTGLAVSWGLRTAELRFRLPEDRRLSHIEVWVWSGTQTEAAATTDAGRREGAQLIYEGNSEGVEWQIPAELRNLSHEFWVVPVARGTAS